METRAEVQSTHHNFGRLVVVAVTVQSSSPFEGDGGFLLLAASGHALQQLLEVLVAELARDLATACHHAQVVFDRGSIFRLGHFDRVH